MHRILTGDELPKEATVFRNIKDRLSCPKHRHENVAYKCVDHDEFICITCYAVYHRKCEGIEELVQCPVNMELSHKTDCIGESANSTKRLKIVKLEKLRLEKENIEKQRAEFITRLNDEVKKLDENSRAKTEEVFVPLLTELENGISKCEELEYEVNSSNKMFKVAKKFYSQDEQTVLSIFLEKTIDRWNMCNQEQTATNYEYLTVKFKGESFFKGVKEIGDITIEKTQDGKPEDSHAVHTSSDELKEKFCSTVDITPALYPEQIVECTPHEDKGQPMEWKVQNITQHRVRGLSDKETCCVNALLLLPSGRLLVADKSNYKLKIFKDNFEFVQECRLDGAPVDVCRVETFHISYECIAAIEGTAKSIQVFLIGKNSIIKCKELCTRHYCLSLAMFRESQIFIVFSEKPQPTGERKPVQIDICDTATGSIMQTFDLKQYFGVSSRIETFRIHCTSKHAVIIPEYDKIHCLEKYTDTPNENWLYRLLSNRELEVVSDIDSDKEGNVYICGKVSKNVHQVSAADYRNSRIIIVHITDPSAICVDSENARILIGRENDENIHVFHMGK